MSRPAPAEIRASRRAAGLTQAEAAALVMVSPRTWPKWEQGERQMPASTWLLWQLRTRGHVAATRR